MQEAVDAWRDASTLEQAGLAAMRARRLVVGGSLDPERVALTRSAAALRTPDASVGPGSSDPGEPGLLPGLAGEPGLVLPDTRCVRQDVLGGSFDDAPARWATVQRAIERWSDDDNTFPALSSHPQRVVGWASLTMATADLDAAHSYAGHAQLHVDVTREALDTC